MQESFLKLNSDKTQVKVFKPNSLKDDTVSFNINDLEGKIEPSTTVKLLGVTFGPKLNFSEFVDKKIQICNLHLRNLRAVRNSIPYEAKVMLVTNLIFANIDYCNALIICSPKYVVLKLQKIMNKAIRFIFGLKRKEHITPYLFKLHILPVEHRIKFKLGIIAYKITRNMAPAYLTEKVSMFQSITSANLRPCSSRDNLMFACSLEQRKRETWITKMILVWNKLPLTLRIIQLNSFKSALKTYYFKDAFTD